MYAYTYICVCIYIYIYSTSSIRIIINPTSCISMVIIIPCLGDFHGLNLLKLLNMSFTNANPNKFNRPSWEAAK